MKAYGTLTNKNQKAQNVKIALMDNGYKGHKGG